VADACIVIPARFASTRFPGKPIAELWGKPLVQHVYERARQARLASRVIIATDDTRIATIARGFGAEVAMTRADHPSGTDRVAEVARSIIADLWVNVQGDEPLLHPETIDAAVAPLAADPSIPMGTVCSPIEEAAELANPNVVKVVFDRDGFALYFSRLPIPFVRPHAPGRGGEAGAAPRAGARPPHQGRRRPSYLPRRRHPRRPGTAAGDGAASIPVAHPAGEAEGWGRGLCYHGAR
jgi:3-deoxy-D-manno-octulosonate cytidylyltransferase